MTTPSPALPPEALAFRGGMSRLGAAVNLVTTDGPSGRHGLTVSAVCSVTDSPPTLLVCINSNAFSHDAFLDNGVLCVNVLNSAHTELSRAFARWTGEDRFAKATWITRDTGAPVLSDASASFDCRIVDHQRKGTHSVLFCEVRSTTLSDGPDEGLIWFGRGFHTLKAAE
ncbi:flavin reductase [Azospirillum griseum]|uniref:Flavin reductase n=1 Tax=Azospirillum griseum TaxID=2496639 RepID=A0A431VFK0_9PROT|nr:flavin reductase [Azospirillum griseum]RTR18630.1 flavin reductase [Azospirillum griseum]